MTFIEKIKAWFAEVYDDEDASTTPPPAEVVDTSILPPLPRSYDDLYRTWGDPKSDSFEDRFMAFCELPSVFGMFPLVHGKRGFYCHKHLVKAFQGVFKDIFLKGISDEVKTWDGTWNVRPIRGSNTMSLHSWGIAIDLNADTNQLGDTHGDMHPEIIKSFKKFSFWWGGDFHGRKDWQHFEYYGRGQG